MRKILNLLIILLLLSCKSSFDKDSANAEIELYNRNILHKQDSLAIHLIELFGSDQIARRNNRIFVGLDSINFAILVNFVKNTVFLTKNF